MTTAVLAKETRLHLIFGLYMAVISALLVIMIVREPAHVQADIEKEMGHTVDYLSEDEQLVLNAKARARFTEYVYESGFYNFVQNALIPAEQKQYALDWQENASAGVLSERWLFRLVENIRLYSYQVIHRLTLMEYWARLMLPMLVAIGLTGYYHGEIKRYQLGGESTRRVRWWLKVLWLVFFFFSVYMITPNIFGPYTIFAPPTLLLVVALSISYIQSMFAKN